jgi:hypothetical protein
MGLKKKSSSIDKLTTALDKMSQKGGYTKDERFWEPTVDSAGNGYAVIRFLDAPAVDGEDGLPWVQVFNHGFKGPSGSWLIDNCPTTLGHKCPVCEYNSTLWNSGIEANKKIASDQKRKLSYISNILVVKDAANPANEGKVMLYKYGKKIHDKITEQLKPQFEDEKAVNPFNFWEGANFKLKIRKVEGYRNYDKSEFEGVSALFDGDDAEIEKVWKASYSLQEFVAATEFKSYDELKTRLDTVLGVNGSSGASRNQSAEDIEIDDNAGTSSTDDVPFDTGTSTSLSFFKDLAKD